MIEKMSVGGTPFIGIVAFTTEDFTITRTDVNQDKIETIASVLGTKVLQTSVARTDLVGIFLAGNSSGILVPSQIEEREMVAIEEAFSCNVMSLETKYTALGNLILCNDKGCIISPTISSLKDEISSFLGVPVEEGIIGGYKNVGSVAVATNKGCLVHPDASQEKMDWLGEILKVPVDHSTANKGVGYIGGCMIANSKGVVVGDFSTGPELGRIDDVLMEEE